MWQQYARLTGAGPAGLTAALELSRTARIVPIARAAGALSRHVGPHGNGMGLGGQRFFCKPDREQDGASSLQLAPAITVWNADVGADYLAGKGAA